MSESIPERIDKYYVLDVAGSGSMGTVYTAYDPFTDRDVAIKVCRPTHGPAQDTLVRSLFLNEVQISSALDHPNIVKVLDAGEHDGEPYIVMEHLGASETLKDYCRPETLLPISRVAEIVFKCARALDFAHRRGVIHCDIKPANIMVTEDADLKIGDFGIAKWNRESNASADFMGSPRYMSPEQARREAVCARTDIYSLGVALFELLTGRALFDEMRNFSDLLERIVSQPPPSVCAIRPEIPRGMDAIVACALSKDPADRYASGGEMASDLAALFDELDLSRSDLSDASKFRIISELEFFRDFTDAQVDEVVHAGEWQTFSANECVFAERSRDLCFYVICAGDVSVTKRGRAICRLSRGDCFGEMGYLANTPRSASVLALDEVLLLKLDSARIEELSESCQLKLNKTFVLTLVERLTRASEEISENRLPQAANA